MLSRRPTRRRRRSSGNKPRRCSAPTVLGPPRAHVTLFPSNEDIPSRLCSTPQPIPVNVPVAHSVDSGTSWLKSQRALGASNSGGQGARSYQLWPGYGNFFDKGSLTSGSQPTPPPSEKALYESTVVWAEAEDHDQAFSVLGSLCEAGLETGNACDFIFKAFFILSGTWPVTVFLVGLLALPLVMTTIGVNYLHECPVEPKLPIYLVVGGCFGILKLLFLLWKQIKRHKEDMGDLHDDEDLLTMTRMTNIALNIFLCVWFAFGHYWVFHIWKPQFHPPLHEPRNWCDETVFMFSFWQLIICHSVIALVLFLSAIMCCCFVCVKCVVVDTKR